MAINPFPPPGGCPPSCEKLADIEKVEVLEYQFDPSLNTLNKLQVRTGDLIWNVTNTPFSHDPNGVTYLILNAADNTATVVNENVSSYADLDIDLISGCTFKTPIVIRSVIQYVDYKASVTTNNNLFFILKDTYQPAVIDFTCDIKEGEQGVPGDHNVILGFSTPTAIVPVREVKEVTVNGVYTYKGVTLETGIQFGSYESNFRASGAISLMGDTTESSFVTNNSLGVLPNNAFINTHTGATTLGGAYVAGLRCTQGKLNIQYRGSTDIIVWR